MHSDTIDTLARRFADRQLSRRQTLMAGGGVAASALLLGGQSVRAQGATPAATPESQAADILAIASDALTRLDLNAVILRVTIDGQELITEALGESMVGVPATKDMHFRNGAVAISYVSMILLQLVDQGIVSLDDTIDTWLPDVPSANLVTLHMLSNMTSGYADYVQQEEFQTAFYADPFRQWSEQELLDIGLSKPLTFEPGTNWGYAHTNVILLGRALEAITGKPMVTLMQEKILDPLGLKNTAAPSTAAIPEPVLHAFSSERRGVLGIDPSIRFYEESSFWNPSWSLKEGTIQTSNIYDLTTTAEAIGSGALLSPESHEAMIAPVLLGFGAPVDGCMTCHTMVEGYVYALGLVISGNWLLQNPLFGGYGSIEAVLPSRKIAIAVATTFGEAGFDGEGQALHSRASWEIFAAIAEYLAPDDAPVSSRPS